MIHGGVNYLTSNDQRCCLFVNCLAFNVGIRETKVDGDWKEKKGRKRQFREILSRIRRPCRECASVAA